MTDTNQSPKKRTNSRRARLERQKARQREVRLQRILLASGITLILVLLIIFFVFSGKRKGAGQLIGVNADVLSYQSKVEAACSKYGISEYSVLMLAIMQQESSGQGTDVFQCSESPFNTLYSNLPNSITDVDYSIDVGAQTFAYCLEQAQCSSIRDTDRVKIALQEYNFGNDYAGWVLENYGSYSEESAYEYASIMMASLGWSSYGDPQYVAHVLNYYSL